MQPSKQDLNNTLIELKNFRDRLRSEIINMSQKLRFPQAKIQMELEKNTQLQQLEKSIKRIDKQIANKS